MYQLNAIRDELRGGINIMNPGWVLGCEALVQL